MSFFEPGKNICNKYQSKFNTLDEKLFIGVATDLELEPINGLRHPAHGTMSGWYIWSGKWSDSSDFFKPVCVEHFIKKYPEIVKYLFLDVGFRFQIDKKAYEDVWYDEKIKFPST